MVEAHTFSLAYIQTGSDKIEPSDGELCSRCHENVKWSESVCQRTVFNNRRELVDSRWHKLQLSNRHEICRLERLPSNIIMVPVNARPLEDVKLNHGEGKRAERAGRFLTTRAPIGQRVKMFRQIKASRGLVKERAYLKQVNQEGDLQRYGRLKAIKKDETSFGSYDKAEMRKATIMIGVSSDFVYTSKSLFWPDVRMLAAVDLDVMQSVSMAIGVQRQTEMNPITIVFAGMNDHQHSRGFLSRLREPTTAEDAVWPAIKDILESMGEVVDTLKEGAFTKITPRACLRDTHSRNLAEKAEAKSAEFVNRVSQVTLEAFWTRNVKGEEGIDRTDSKLERLGAG